LHLVSGALEDELVDSLEGIDVLLFTAKTQNKTKCRTKKRKN